MPRVRTHARNRRWQRQPLDRKPSLFERLRAQTSSEYMIMVAGVLFFALFMFLVIKGDLLPNAQRTTGQKTAQFQDEYGKPYQFYDNFDTDSLERWNSDPLNPKTWKITNKLLVSKQPFVFRPLLVGDSTWGQYKISVDVRMGMPENGNIGIIARKNVNGMAYICGISGTGLFLIASHELAFFSPYDLVGAVQMPSGFNTQNWHTLTFTLDGKHLRCQIDPDHFIQADRDWSFNGEAGVIAGANYADYAFDNFKITRLPELKQFPNPSSPPLPPVFTPNSIIVSPNASGVDVQWKTDRLSTSILEMGTNPTLYHSIVASYSMVTNHHIAVSGLLPNTLYYYQMTSCIMTACAKSGFLTFMTLPTPVIVPQLLDERATPGERTSEIRWETDQPASSRVVYGRNQQYGQYTPFDPTEVIPHIVTLSGLYPETVYHYRVTSCFNNGADCNTSTLDHTFTTLPSSVAPVFSNIGTDSGVTTATISWDTDIPADTQLNYGLDSGVSQNSPLDSTKVVHHMVTLTGLQAAHTYFYSVHGCSNGHCADSPVDASGPTFTTLAGDLPSISPITVVPTFESADISWTTSPSADTQVFYGPSLPYTYSTTLIPGYTLAHQQTLTSLTANQLYHFQVKSCNSNGCASSSDQTFTTLPVPVYPEISDVVATTTCNKNWIAFSWKTYDPPALANAQVFYRHGWDTVKSNERHPTRLYAGSFVHPPSRPWLHCQSALSDVGLLGPFLLEFRRLCH